MWRETRGQIKRFFFCRQHAYLWGNHTGGRCNGIHAAVVIPVTTVAAAQATNCKIMMITM